MKDVVCKVKETSELSWRLPRFTVLRVSRAQRGRTGRARQTPWVEETEVRVQRDWGHQSSQDRAPKRRGLHRHRAPKACRPTTPCSTQQSTNHARVREAHEARERPQERIRRKSGWCSHKTRNSVCFHQPDWKTHNSWGPGESSQEAVVWAVADTQPETGHVSGPASQSTTDKSERTCYPITLLHPRIKQRRLTSM